MSMCAEINNDPNLKKKLLQQILFLMDLEFAPDNKPIRSLEFSNFQSIYL